MIYHMGRPAGKTLAERMSTMKPGQKLTLECDTTREKNNTQSRIALTAKTLGLKVKTHRVEYGVEFEVIE